MGIEITKLGHVHGHLDALLIHLGDEDDRHTQAAAAAAAAKDARLASAGETVEVAQDG